MILVASDQWWDKDNPRGKGNDVGSSPGCIIDKLKNIILRRDVKHQTGELQGGGSDSEKDESQGQPLWLRGRKKRKPKKNHSR